MTHSSFFTTYRNLFEYDKYIGGSDSGDGSATSGSFLQKYKECEERQTQEYAQHVSHTFIPSYAPPAAPTTNEHLIFTTTPAFMTTTTVSPNHQNHYQQRHDIGLRHSSNRQLGTSQTALLSSPTRLAQTRHCYHSQVASQQQPETDHAPQSPTKSTSYSPHKSNPACREWTAPVTTVSSLSARQVRELPKLSELLIDSSARAMVIPATKRMDDAKKVEFLIGSKCVGRVSAASSNLPPAIRRRLQVGSTIKQRRELLYEVLREDYDRLCSNQ